jgi:hypothetical protein
MIEMTVKTRAVEIGIGYIVINEWIFLEADEELDVDQEEDLSKDKLTFSECAV